MVILKFWIEEVYLGFGFITSLNFFIFPQTIQISKKFVDLHAQYSPQIIAACKRAAADGSPVNPPIWWISPTDTTAHDIWDG